MSLEIKHKNYNATWRTWVTYLLYGPPPVPEEFKQDVPEDDINLAIKEAVKLIKEGWAAPVKNTLFGFRVKRLHEIFCPEIYKQYGKCEIILYF